MEVVGGRSSEGGRRREEKEEKEGEPRLKSNNPTRTRWGIRIYTKGNINKDPYESRRPCGHSGVQKGTWKSAHRAD